MPATENSISHIKNDNKSNYVFKTIPQNKMDEIINNVRKNRECLNENFWDSYIRMDNEVIKLPVEASIEKDDNNQVIPFTNLSMDDYVKKVIDHALEELTLQVIEPPTDSNYNIQPENEINNCEIIEINTKSPSISSLKSTQSNTELKEFEKNELEKSAIQLSNTTICESSKNDIPIKLISNNHNNDITRKNEIECLKNSETIESHTGQQFESEDSVHNSIINSSEQLDLQSNTKRIKSTMMKNDNIKPASSSNLVQTTKLCKREKFEMMRLMKKNNIDMKNYESNSSPAADIMTFNGRHNENMTDRKYPGLYEKNRSKLISKIGNLQQKILASVEMIRDNVYKLNQNNVDLHHKPSDPNSFLINFSKNFLSKIEFQINYICHSDLLPTQIDFHQIFSIYSKINESLTFYLNYNMHTYYDFNLEKLSALIELILSILRITFEFELFDENNMKAQQLLEECQSLQININNYQHKIQKQQNIGPNKVTKITKNPKFSMYACGAGDMKVAANKKLVTRKAVATHKINMSHQKLHHDELQKSKGESYSNKFLRNTKTALPKQRIHSRSRTKHITTRQNSVFAFTEDENNLKQALSSPGYGDQTGSYFNDTIKRDKLHINLMTNRDSANNVPFSLNDHGIDVHHINKNYNSEWVKSVAEPNCSQRIIENELEQNFESANYDNALNIRELFQKSGPEKIISNTVDEIFKDPIQKTKFDSMISDFIRLELQDNF